MNFALFKSHLMVIAIENISFIDPPFVYLEHKANFIKQLNQLNCAGYTHSQKIGQLAQNYLPSQGQTGMQN